MLANDRSLKRGAVMALLAALLQATVADRAGRRGRARPQRHRIADEPGRRLAGVRELCGRRRDRTLAFLAQGRRADRRAETLGRAQPGAGRRPAFAGVGLERAGAQPFGRGFPRRPPARPPRRSTNAAASLRRTPPRSTAPSPGATPPER